MTPEKQRSAILQHESARLIEAELFRCTRCRRVLPADMGILVLFQRNVLVGLCPDCFDSRPIVLRVVTDERGERGIEARVLSEAEATALHGMSRPQVVLAKPSDVAKVAKVAQRAKPIVSK